MKPKFQRDIKRITIIECVKTIIYMETKLIATKW